MLLRLLQGIFLQLSFNVTAFSRLVIVCTAAARELLRFSSYFQFRPALLFYYFCHSF
ncbi:hypothetical protein [Methanimicrococcus hongohii]|uniref:hypothetical protein n=1 Tax=Methanimicrococcus hongohii TaxID=3028295 RepID=UPI002930379B|nr:hypothetical protein [Methanimicrococcus sp. Hf6]